jgi:class 3 adenylate cyclase
VYCPRCQTENPEKARFCLNCGQALERRCTNCQTVLAPGVRFCMECGQPVMEQTPVDAVRLSRLTAAAPSPLIQKIRTASKEKPKLNTGALGERRTVTTLIVDVVGSTKLAEQLNLETWMAGMNNAFDRIAPIIYKYEGTIVRLLGDSLLAFFGAAVAHEDDPQRSVRAGMEILGLMDKYASELKKAHNVDFAVRVCINTGPVVIGPVGDDLRFEYTASGSTVNLTSRIKFAGPSMSVLITGNTYRYIAPYFDCDDLGSLEVKGESEELRVYQVRAARAVLGRTRGFADLESPMVGRDQELATLQQLCDAVQMGLGRAVLVVGEPGLGKTRLIQEWQKNAEKEKDSLTGTLHATRAPLGRWVIGRCTSYGQGLAYRLLIDVIKNILGVSVGSEEPEVHTALLGVLRRLFGDQMMEVYPYLGHLLSVKLKGEAQERANITDPQALQTQYLTAIQRMLLTSTKESPLVIVLEDLHWADASSTELIIKLLPLVLQAPILLCLVTRPEREAVGWKLVSAARELLGGSLTEITLGALSDKDSRSLVANLLDIEALPERVRELILKKAEGNPFFVEEVIRMLIERGAIQHHEGTWIAQQDILDRDIPDNLNGLLLARIDRLPAEARYTLLVASVIGRTFPMKVLLQVMQRSVG